MAKNKNRARKPSFKDLLNSLTRSEAPRIINRTEERQYFLIVTEGEQTEPNYFKSLIKELPNHLADIEIVGEGANTISVVKAAMEIRDKRNAQSLLPPFDEVWVVFDKDDFPARNFNRAIQLAAKENIKAAYSNEAFELWYILHFQYLDAAVNRDRYIEILKDILGDYQKNDGGIYALLKERGDEGKAIRRAKKLYRELGGGNPAAEKPTTLVYKLVERLNRFKI